MFNAIRSDRITMIYWLISDWLTNRPTDWLKLFNCYLHIEDTWQLYIRFDVSTRYLHTQKIYGMHNRKQLNNQFHKPTSLQSQVLVDGCLKTEMIKYWYIDIVKYLFTLKWKPEVILSPRPRVELLKLTWKRYAPSRKKFLFYQKIIDTVVLW